MDGFNWFGVSQCDPRAVDLYSRHYSARKLQNKRTWLTYGIAGPGETLTLLTRDGAALFVWRKERYGLNQQEGVNCAVFRNEGNLLSSKLIQEAERLAWRKWPGERLFTYVNPEKIRSTNPGFCFLCAGWRVCGETPKSLIILEKYPQGWDAAAERAPAHGVQQAKA